MDNFDDVEQEVMFHDADCVSAVVRELVEMSSRDINRLPTDLRMKVMSMRSTFLEWHWTVTKRKIEETNAEMEKRIRLGFEE